MKNFERVELGAMTQAEFNAYIRQTIRDYWAEVHATTRRDCGIRMKSSGRISKEGDPYHSLRSNMVDGLPPNYLKPGEKIVWTGRKSL